MSMRSCEEFIVGMCPNEEFYEDNVTIKCPYTHITSEKQEYMRSQSLRGFERRVLSRYKEIIREVNNKVALLRKLLEREILDEDLRNALDECSRIIELKKTTEFNFEKTHSLLVLHGKLLESIPNVRSGKEYDVCTNCGAFKKEFASCDHKFCSKYVKLRQLTQALEKKLKM